MKPSRFNGVVALLDGVIQVIIPNENGEILWATEIETVEGWRLLHILPATYVQYLCAECGYRARVSATGDLSGASLSGPNTIYALRMYAFGGGSEPTREALALAWHVMRWLQEQAARGVTGVIPSKWLPKLPTTWTIAPGMVYQGPVWARLSWWGRAYTLDQRKAYLSAAERLSGMRVWAGVWRWRPEGAIVGCMPVHIKSETVRFPNRGEWLVQAVLSSDVIDRLNKWGRLELVECDTSQVFPRFNAAAAVANLHPELAKAAYVQWWGSMVTASSRRYAVGRGAGDGVDSVGLGWSKTLTSGARRLWGAAIAWQTAMTTSTLAASFGDKAVAVHIDSVIVKGVAPAAAPVGWAVKEQGLVKVFGPGCWDWYKDAPPYVDDECYDNVARWRTKIKSARMLTEDSAENVVKAQFTINGYPKESE